MDRRDFLKLLGVGAASVLVAPKLLLPDDFLPDEPMRRFWTGWGSGIRRSAASHTILLPQGRLCGLGVWSEDINGATQVIYSIVYEGATVAAWQKTVRAQNHLQWFANPGQELVGNNLRFQSSIPLSQLRFTAAGIGPDGRDWTYEVNGDV